MKKRDFLKIVSASLVFASIPKLVSASVSPNKKRVLVLGGRNFIGPSIVRHFQQAGWEVTLLNRGLTNPHLFPELNSIICDREKEHRSGLNSIRSEIEHIQWDSVVDTWQKSPKAVLDFINEFKGSFKHYHYISSVSVYDDWNELGIVESSALNTIPDFPTSIKENHRYAIRKTLAETAVMENLENYTIYRSHGMRDFRTPDHTNPNEENYWPIRFARGGEILLPDAKDHYYQITDVQSLCRFILNCTDNKIFGAYNVAYKPIKFKDYVNSLIKVTGKPNKLIWIPEAFLIKNGIRPYKDISAWKPKPAGSYHFNVDKAFKNGLTNRPLEILIKDQINGYKNRYPQDRLRYGQMFRGIKVGGLSMSREKELIHKWLRS